jgi:CRISPR/Cas system CMR-associated protein Cmr3 (group 5 of RAMP superfamily)
MKNVKLSTIEKQIRDGKVECLTDLRIGWVEIRNCTTRKIYYVNVIA